MDQPSSPSPIRSAILAAIAIAIAVQPASAVAAPGTGAGRSLVLDQIAVTNSRALDFGRLAAGTTAGRVVIAPATGARTVTGGVTAVGGTPTSASFQISGTPNRVFTLNFPSASVTLNNGLGNTMVVNTFRISGARRFTAAGTRTILVGARLNVNANQAAGAYTGTFQIRVNYQ